MERAAGLPLLVGCFLVSGLSALVYQIAWTREFSFVFGTAELAVATVLAGYMAGLASGAVAGGRLAERIRRPVLAYALLELGIAVSALAVPWAIRAFTPLYVRLFASGGTPADAEGLPTALFHLVCSMLILVVPTGMMGATLPLLTRHAVRREREIGTRVGLLYAVNTVGAVIGAVLAGFVLLPALGLRNTVYVAVLGNVVVFALAALLAAYAPLAPLARPERSPTARATRAGWILPLVLVSGIVSFTYEVFWTRLLGHVLGGSTYAFATMLAAFLTGIALGASLAARAARGRAAAARGFALAQLGAAAGSWIAFLALDHLPALLPIGGTPAARLSGGALLAAATLLPGALCIGATFPFAVRLLARDEHEAARATARVYAWNTMGAILGALLAAFLILPALGFVRTLTLAIGTNLLLAGVAAMRARPRSPRLAFAAAAALVALVLLPLSPPWRVLATSPLMGGVASGERVHFATGRSATVLLYEQSGEWHLRTNGLPEASIQRPGARKARYTVAHWLGLLPVLLRPDLRDLLVVGLGGGIALETVPPAVERIDVVELEPEVVRANRAVAARRRRDPLADPRVSLHVNDARGALLLAERRYDAIVSQPSHPWTAGASHLYTREFFTLVRERLAPDGVFVQWMGLAFLSPELVRSLLATLSEVFPHVQVYAPVPAVMLFVASDAALAPEQSAPVALGRHPESFAPFGLLAGDDLLAALVFDEADVLRLSRGVPLVTDDRNRLQTESPWIAGHGRAAVQSWLAQQPPPEAWSRTADGAGLVSRLLAHHARPRVTRFVAEHLEPGVPRRLGRALLALDSRPRVALREVEASLRAAPDSPWARTLRLVLERPRLVADGDAPPPVPAPLTPAESAVVAGWRAAAREQWQELAREESRLASIPVAHPLHDVALLLRATWRAHGEADRAREALPMLDTLLAGRLGPALWLLRARAATRAGEAVPALESFWALARAGQALAPAERREVRRLFAELRVPEELEAWKRALGAEMNPPSPARGSG